MSSLLPTNFRVLETDYDDYAIIYSVDLKGDDLYVWLYSRTNTLSNQTIRLTTILDNFGIDASELVFPVHN